MEIEQTPIEGLLIIKPQVFNDARGFFCETFNAKRYAESGITNQFVQDNQSCSSFGVVRGLHFQKGEFAQAKLVSVTVGKVWDVAVDLRKESPTYGQWYGVELTETNHYQYFIPRGFAHGFSVLSDKAIFTYKCDNAYHPEAEGGIRWNDPTLNIDWHIPVEHIITSEKDMHHPFFNQL